MTERFPAGTQSIMRAIRVMKAVANRKEIGWRLTDLAAHCGLGKATTYRIVACLAAARVVLQRTGDRRYVPGPLPFELALSTPAYAAFTAAVHEDLARMAKIGGNAFLYLRSGDEVVCIDRVGTTPMQPVTAVGRRRPIAQSTFGISMILALPKEELRELLENTEQKIPHDGRAAAYRKVLERSRRYGFGFNRGDVVPRLTCIAIPMLDRQNRPFAAMGITGPSPSLRGKTLRNAVQLLRREVRRIEQEHAPLIAEISH